MTERLIDFLIRLAPRERGLLGLLVLGVLPVAVVLGWLWPLHETRGQARAALAEAQALHAWVGARRAEKAALALPEASAADLPPAIGVSALEQSLIARQLRPSLSALETGSGGEVALRFDEVSFVDLMRWVDREDPDWGYRISGLRIEPTDRPAYVEARLTLVPAVP